VLRVLATANATLEEEVVCCLHWFQSFGMTQCYKVTYFHAVDLGILIHHCVSGYALFNIYCSLDMPFSSLAVYKCSQEDKLSPLMICNMLAEM